MKIAIDLTPLYNRKATGVENYGIELYHALMKQNIEVYPIFRVKNTLDSNPNTQIIKSKNRLLVENLLLPFLIRKLNVDIILFPIFPPPIDIYWGTKCRIIPTIHDLAFKLFSNTLSRNARFYMKPKYLLALKYSDKIITISETVKKEIQTVSPVPVINLGENISRTYENIKNKSDIKFLSKWNLEANEYFISVSTIEPRKNILYLLKVFKEYKKINTHIILVFVGRKGWGENDKELQRLLEDLIESVVFTDYVTEEELISLYHFSKAFFLLSLYEGFGRTPLEALACGSRIFVSDIPIFKETLGDSAIYLPLNDIESCIKIISAYQYDVKQQTTIALPFDILEKNIINNIDIL